MDQQDHDSITSKSTSDGITGEVLENLARYLDNVYLPTGNERGTEPVERLPTVPKERLIMLLRMNDQEKEKRRAERAGEVVHPGLYLINESAYIALPENLFSEDSAIGMLVAEIVTNHIDHVELKLLPANTNFTSPNYDQKFVMGLLSGLTTNTNRIRKQSKESFDLGAICGFALRVKQEFIHNELLGMNALVSDHFFFGNAKTEKTNAPKKSYYIRDKLRSCFGSDEISGKILSILNYFAKRIRLRHLDEPEYERVIMGNIVPFQDLMNSLYPRKVVTLPRKKTEIRVMKPSLPKSSPVFTKKEMILITKTLRPSFSDITDIQKDYLYYVRSYGFSGLTEKLQDKILLRRQICQNFGRVVKSRFTAISSIAEKKDLRRNELTPELVIAYTQTMADAALTLRSDIGHILRGFDLCHNLSLSFKVNFESEKDAKGYLYNKCLEVYDSIIPDYSVAKGLQIFKISKALEESKAHEAIKLLYGLDSGLAKFDQYTDRLARCPKSHLPTRIENLEKVATKLNDEFVKFMSYEEFDRTLSVRATAGQTTTYDSVVHEYKKTYTVTADVLKNQVNLLLIEVKSESVRKGLASLQKVALGCALYCATTPVVGYE